MEECINLIELANKEVGVELNIIDIGGGFPADYSLNGETDLQEFC